MTHGERHRRFCRLWAKVKRGTDAKTAEHVEELIVGIAGLDGHVELLARLREAHDIFERGGRGVPVAGWRGSLAQRNWAHALVHDAEALLR